MFYFFITNHIKQKEVIIEYFPTEEITSNCFTKPVQGTTFRQHRATIINFKD